MASGSVKVCAVKLGAMMKQFLPLACAALVLACCTPIVIEPEVVVEIEGEIEMIGTVTIENVTTGETHTVENAITDRCINEMLEALSTGELDEVGMIGFIHYYWGGISWRWDTVYLPVIYDGGAYDTCNWVRWRAGWRSDYLRITTTIKYWYLLPGISLEPPLSEAYATEPENLTMQYLDSVSVTWTYVQSAKP